MTLTRIGLTLAFSVFALAAAQAETITLKTMLNGDTEVPAVQTPAKGTAQVVIDTTAKTATWKVDFQGLSGPATAAHIHGPAMPGANAGVMVAMQAGQGSSPIQGSGPVTDAQIADLLAGKAYVNVHTKEHPAGEIRGYLAK